MTPSSVVRSTSTSGALRRIPLAVSTGRLRARSSGLARICRMVSCSFSGLTIIGLCGQGGSPSIWSSSTRGWGGRWGGGGHSPSPPDQLHVTVRSFGGATDIPTLARALHGLPPIALTPAGLGFTRDTVQLRLLPDNASLGEARRRIANTHGVPSRQARQRLLAPVAFANVLRLNGLVAPELRHEVAGLRRLLAGERIVLNELTLVHTDKVATPERTQVLERYTLE